MTARVKTFQGENALCYELMMYLVSSVHLRNSVCKVRVKQVERIRVTVVPDVM